LVGHLKDRGKHYRNSRTNSLQSGEDDVDRDACTFLRKIGADVSVELRSDWMATIGYRASDWDRMVKIGTIRWQSDIELAIGIAW
jgi:hypothetical protein